MDTAVKERLIGAAVLVVAVVLVVPALLRGPRPPAGPVEPSAGDTRVVEIDLAGNDDDRGASDEPAPEPSAIPPEQDVTSPPSAAASKEPTPAESGTAVAPPPATAAARPVAAVPPSTGWVVQVAALSKAGAAQQMAASLKAKGYAAFVQEHRSGGRVLYRVRIGPETEREKAEVLARRLTAAGFKPTVMAYP